MLPNVKVTLVNGALGAVADSPDGVAALVLTGVTVPDKIVLAEPRVIYSLQEAEALGITAEGANVAAYQQIRDFYSGYRYITGSEVAELYIMLVANTLTLTQMADVTEAAGAKKLVDFAGGRVRLLGLGRDPGGDYEPDITDGIDKDCLDALTKAHDLGNSYAARQQPLRVLIEGRSFALANIGDLKDLHTMTFNRAGIVLMNTEAGEGSSVGFVLGVAAALPVQRSIARVKNGQLPLNAAFIGDSRVELVSGIDTIHDKGYISVRTFPNRSGYYFTDDPMAVAETDDYALLARGRVIDKAHRIAYNTYVDELNDDVEVDAGTGALAAGYIAYLTQRITNNIELGMVDEISGLSVFIDPNQNIIATGRVNIKLKITPVGYNKQIEIDLGFDNPANG